MNSANYELTIGPLAFGFPHLEILIVKKIQRMKKLLSLAAISSLFIASQASAINLPASTLAIDFRDGVPADVTATANTSIGWTSAAVTQNSTYGLGVDTARLPDLSGEVGQPWGSTESLLISFANGMGNGLTGVWVALLFDHVIFDNETGNVDVDPGPSFSFMGDSYLLPVNDGAVYVDFGGALNLDSAAFTGSSYSVVGFTKAGAGDPGTPVSDTGSTLALLGLGVLGLAGIRRKMAK